MPNESSTLLTQDSSSAASAKLIRSQELREPAVEDQKCESGDGRHLKSTRK